MRRTLIACLVLSGIVTLTAVAQKSTSSKSNPAEALLGAAIHQEEAEGNLEAAIASYKKFLAQYGNNRPLAAKAQYHLGVAYEKLGNAEAKKAYEQVVRNYSDQSEVAADARRRLAGLEGVRSAEPLTVRQLFRTREFPTVITADGRFMGIADGPNSAIGVRDMVSGQTKWLVTGDEAATEGECTILSPDQKQVVYAWYPRINGVMYGEVRIVANEAGSKPRILIPGNEEYQWVDPVAWSPDGKSVLIIIRRRDQTWQLGWVSTADGAIRVLKSLEWRLRRASLSTSLSPDGKYIAYAALPTNPSHPLPTKGPVPPDSTGEHIYLLAADGSSETDLTKGGGMNHSPTWTPDGAHILFISDRYGSNDLWSLPIQNGKATAPASLVKRNFNGWPMGMTRSGSYYYGEGEAGIAQTFVVEMEPTGKIRNSGKPTQEPLVGNLPAWSPDGKYIALQRTRSKSEIIRIVRAFDTGEEKVYAHAGLVAGPARWLSDSSGFLETIQNENGTHSIYRVDLKSGQFKQVLNFDPAPKHSLIGLLSSDDKTLYVGVPDLRSLIAIDLASGQQKTIFKLPRTGTIPGIAINANDRKLGLIVRGEKDTFTIATASIDGSDYRELYTGPNYVGRIAWEKDGRGILFSVYQNSTWKLMSISEDGGKPEPTGLEHASSFNLLSLNKDGSRLAFSSNESLGGWEVFALDNVLPILKAAK